MTSRVPRSAGGPISANWLYGRITHDILCSEQHHRGPRAAAPSSADAGCVGEPDGGRLRPLPGAAHRRSAEQSNERARHDE
ncbi:hypothetical protein A33M_1804 [Rhodovulum sp. PH10]|nr:hypothetical protein A33M_1804 [Rhodovulum sp. PH10]